MNSNENSTQHSADYEACPKPMADDDRIPSEVLRSLPEKFWDVAGWNNQGWSPVSVDPADRKRIVNGVLDVLDAMALQQSDGADDRLEP